MGGPKCGGEKPHKGRRRHQTRFAGLRVNRPVMRHALAKTFTFSVLYDIETF
jgi:hypothetical protein